jgi:hypothetical protein
MKKRRRRTQRAAPVSYTELEEFKAFLGPLAKDHSDGELCQLRRELRAMADILLDLYVAKTKKQKLPSIAF